MKIRTVVVEDEPLARERLRSLLEAESDIEVVAEAEDGQSAIERLNRNTWSESSSGSPWRRLISICAVPSSCASVSISRP